MKPDPKENRVQRAKATENQIHEFSKLVYAGRDAWLKAGKLLVQLSDNDPLTMTKIQKLYPTMSMDTLHMFDRIGRGQIHVALLGDASPGVKKLLELPYPLQEHFHEASIPVVTRVGDALRTVPKKVQELTFREASQVFSPKGLRSEAEQRELLESQTKLESFAPPRYEFNHSKKSVRVRCNVELTLEELEGMVKVLKATP